VRASSEPLSLSAVWVWPCSSTSTAPTGEQLYRSGGDLVQHRLQRLVARRGRFHEDRFAIGVATVHAVQHQAVEVDVEIGRRAEALDQRERAAVSLLGLQPGLIEQEACDGAVYDLQHGPHQLGLRGQQQAQRNRQPNLANPFPLAHRHTRGDVVRQVGSRLGHAQSPARQAKASALAAEDHQLVVPITRQVRKPSIPISLPSVGDPMVGLSSSSSGAFDIASTSLAPTSRRQYRTSARLSARALGRRR